MKESMLNYQCLHLKKNVFHALNIQFLHPKNLFKSICKNEHIDYNIDPLIFNIITIILR